MPSDRLPFSAAGNLNRDGSIASGITSFTDLINSEVLPMGWDYANIQTSFQLGNNCGGSLRMICFTEKETEALKRRNNMVQVTQVGRRGTKMGCRHLGS